MKMIHAEVLRLHASGLSYAQIGERFRLTRKQVAALTREALRECDKAVDGP